MDKKRGLKTVLILSILAIILFAYLTMLHYQPSGSKFCDISEGVSCDIVNKSLYSEIFGIPVAILGLITFVIVAILSWGAMNRKHWKLFGFNLNEGLMLKSLFFILLFSTIFSIWLIYAELFLILSICLLCVVSDIIILASLFIAIKLNKGNLKKKTLNFAIIVFYLVSIIVAYLVYRILVEL